MMNVEGARKRFEKIGEESGEVWWRFGGREGRVKISIIKKVLES